MVGSSRGCPWIRRNRGDVDAKNAGCERQDGRESPRPRPNGGSGFGSVPVEDFGACQRRHWQAGPSWRIGEAGKKSGIGPLVAVGKSEDGITDPDCLPPSCGKERPGRTQSLSCQIYNRHDPASSAQSRPGPSLPRSCPEVQATRLIPVILVHLSPSSFPKLCHGGIQTHREQSRGGIRRPVEATAGVGVRRVSEAEAAM